MKVMEGIKDMDIDTLLNNLNARIIHLKKFWYLINFCVKKLYNPHKKIVI